MEKRFISKPGVSTFLFSCLSLSKFVSLTVLSIILFLFTSQVYSAQVTLAWDPNTEPDLAGYKIYYGFSSGNYKVTVDVGNQTNCTISTLQEGQTYYFAATAYDDYGNESEFSNEVPYYAPETDADLDGDGDVDVVDIMLVAGRWHCKSGDDCYDGKYDLDGNGEINIVDIMVVAAHWGECCQDISAAQIGADHPPLVSCFCQRRL